MQSIVVEQGTDGIGLSDIVVDIGLCPDDLTSVELGEDLLHVPVHVTDRGDGGLTGAFDLPRSVAEHRTVRIGRSLVIRTIIIGSYPCVVAPTTMPREERGIVVDREGADLLSSRVVVCGTDLIQRLTIEDITRGEGEESRGEDQRPTPVIM